MALQVYQINEYDYWAGDCSPEEILAAYMKDTGVTHDEATGDIDILPTALTDTQLDTMKVQIMDADYDKEENELLTARQYLTNLQAEGRQFPCFFGGREW